MKAFKSILVVLDRSKRDAHVLEKAVVLARALGAHIELFLCDAEHEFSLRQNYDPRATEAGRTACTVDGMRYLDSVRATLQIDPSAVSASVWCDSPLYQGINHKVAEAKPDLVMKSPDCDHPDCRLAFSDTDWQLASTCPAPLMFVGKRVWSTPPRIAAAIDPAARDGLARAIAEVALALRAGVQGEVEFVTCLDASKPEADRELHARSIQELVLKVSPQRQQVRVLAGEPETLLPPFAAEHRYDLLTMGALAHRVGLAPRVGSLTGRLIDALDCDFVLVKPEDEPATLPAPGKESGVESGRSCCSP